MKFIRFPVKLEFNLCTRDLSIFVRTRYRSGTIAGAQLRGWNQLLCLGFRERSVRKEENFLERNFFCRIFCLHFDLINSIFSSDFSALCSSASSKILSTATPAIHFRLEQFLLTATLSNEAHFFLLPTFSFFFCSGRMSARVVPQKPGGSGKHRTRPFPLVVKTFIGSRD